MLKTIEVLIDVNGTVHWLEPLVITKPTRALVTVLEQETMLAKNNTSDISQGNAGALLALLQSPAFASRPSFSAEEIEAQIQENRDSWD